MYMFFNKSAENQSWHINVLQNNNNKVAEATDA